MANEIEAKMRVDGHGPVIAALEAHGAQRVMTMMEENVFFDTPDAALLAERRGVRLRTHAPVGESSEQPAFTRVTYKGPKQAGELKVREEIEFGVDDAGAATAFLRALGYVETLRFEKRRDRWRANDCLVELDELPVVGCFVEIEGPREAAIYALRDALGLGDAPLLTDSYASMVAAALEASRSAERVLRFAEEAGGG